MIPQDLHIHTTWSTGDGAIVPQQTIGLIARLPYARVAGISDHLELIGEDRFEDYRREVAGAGLRVGMEVNGHEWVRVATKCAIHRKSIVRIAARDLVVRGGHIGSKRRSSHQMRRSSRQAVGALCQP
jgi:hypothetical protein